MPMLPVTGCPTCCANASADRVAKINAHSEKKLALVNTGKRIDMVLLVNKEKQELYRLNLTHALPQSSTNVANVLFLAFYVVS